MSMNTRTALAIFAGAIIGNWVVDRWGIKTPGMSDGLVDSVLGLGIDDALYGVAIVGSTFASNWALNAIMGGRK